MTLNLSILYARTVHALTTYPRFDGGWWFYVFWFVWFPVLLMLKVGRILFLIFEALFKFALIMAFLMTCG